jgi:DNA helicase-2/ATP-dependent DNA helicase PcrA
VVGDPNQAIYGWNGAEPTALTDFARREPGATVVRLDDNFRSSPQILTVAGAILAAGGGRADLRPHCSEGPIPSVRAYGSDVDEARGVVRAVRSHHRPGTSWSRIAVLARTNAQLAMVETALREAEIPYKVRGGGGFLGLPEVRDALGTMQRRGGPLGPHLTALAHDDDLSAVAGPVAERRAVLDELVRLGHEHLALDPSGTVDGFVGWLTATVGRDAGPEGEGVDLATFHAAKGLEWPVVFLIGLERGLVPIGHAKTDGGLAEERRLLYVAVTRAEEELHCSWARERTFGSRTAQRQPSPWLADIENAREALRTGTTLDEQLARVAQARRKLASTSGGRSGTTVGLGADPAVFAALKAWRASAARAAGVPAYVIFHDTTLAALAEAKPRTRDHLLAMPGLGPVKADRYGDALLQVLADAG